MSHEQLQTAPQPHELASADLLFDQYTDANGCELPPDETLHIEAFGVTDYGRQEQFTATDEGGVVSQVEGVPVMRIDGGDGNFTDIVDISGQPQELEPGVAANYAAINWQMTEQGWRTTGIEPVIPGEENQINRHGFTAGIDNEGSLSVTATGSEPAKVSLLTSQQFVRREAVTTDAMAGSERGDSEVNRIEVAHGVGIVATKVEMPTDNGPVFRESPLHGIKEKAVSFAHAIAERLKEGSHKSSQEVEATSALLQEQGISADAQGVPESFRLALLKPEDWDRVRVVKNQVLCLWSKAKARSIESYYEHFNTQPNKRPQEVLQEEALFKSLPLLHSTSARALYAALETGSFKSNRQLVEWGVDVTAGVGNTNALDREVGLDNYVFADFGRPASNRSEGEVTVVLEPEAMQQEGAFLTEHDLQDSLDNDGDVDYEAYLKDSLLPEDFDRVGLKRILAARSMRSYYAGRGLGESYHAMSLKDFVAGSDSDPASGEPQFSTWEVKMPTVSTEQIRKVVFTNPEQFADFKERYGDRIPCELADAAALKSDVKPTEEDISRKEAENRHLYGIDERYEKELSMLYDADYQTRLTTISQSGQAREGYVLLNHPDPHSPSAIKQDPAWYRVAKRTYGSAEEAIHIAHNNYDPGGVRYRSESRRSRGRDPGQRPMPEALVFNPEITIAKVVYAPDGTAVIEELSVENVS